MTIVPKILIFFKNGMTNQEIVECLALSGIVEDISNNIKVTKDYYDDFVQETYLTLLEYDNAKLRDIFSKNQIKFFIARICINQWNSKNSPFFYKYKRHSRFIDANADLITLSKNI